MAEVIPLAWRTVRALRLPILVALLLVVVPVTFSNSGAAISYAHAGAVSTFLGWTIGTPLNYLGTALAVVIGTFLNAISVTVLEISSALFDFVFGYTVLQFGSLASSGVMDAINIGWSVFRDIANIVIIAMFVFVALQTILGSHEYGVKKMIARLLIVAVLINFSLLFTKMIIDASNFVSTQFYKAAQLPVPPTQGSTASGQAASIASAFENIAGVTTLGQNAGNIWDAGTSSSGNAIIALIYAILTAILTLAAAIVLLYGSFLLISRALLMIFLMLTSSIAFATFLIPGAAKGRFGWGAWWRSLLKNAVLAPLLTVLLWISLTMGTALRAAICSSASTCGPLGALATNHSPSYIATLFSFILVLGLLFIAFRVAASFSHEIGEFDLAAVLPRAGFEAAAGVGSLVGRGTFGLGADAFARTGIARKAANLPIIGRSIDRALYGAAKGSFDVRNLPGAKEAGKLLGVELGSAVGKGGYLKMEKDVKDAVQHLKAEQAEFVGRETRGEKQAKQDSDASKTREEAYKSELNTTENKPASQEYDKIVSKYVEKAQKDLLEQQIALQKKQNEMLEAANSGNTAAAQGHRRDAQELQQRVQAQTEKIKQAQAGTNAELRQQLANLPQGVRDLKDKIQLEQDNRRQLDAVAGGAKRREHEFVENIGNQRYLSLFLDKVASKEIQKKVAKEIGKTKEQKDAEKLLKGLAKMNEPAHQTSAPAPTSHETPSTPAAHDEHH